MSNYNTLLQCYENNGPQPANRTITRGQLFFFVCVCSYQLYTSMLIPLTQTIMITEKKKTTTKKKTFKSHAQPPQSPVALPSP